MQLTERRHTSTNPRNSERGSGRSSWLLNLSPMEPSLPIFLIKKTALEVSAVFSMCATNRKTSTASCVLVAVLIRMRIRILNQGTNLPHIPLPFAENPSLRNLFLSLLKCLRIQDCLQIPTTVMNGCLTIEAKPLRNLFPSGKCTLTTKIVDMGVDIVHLPIWGILLRIAGVSRKTSLI